MGASLARLGCGSDVSLAFPCLHSRRAYTCRDEEYRPVFGILVRVAVAGVASEFIGVSDNHAPFAMPSWFPDMSILEVGGISRGEMSGCTYLIRKMKLHSVLRCAGDPVQYCPR